jgi:hypothetical protein
MGGKSSKYDIDVVDQSHSPIAIIDKRFVLDHPSLLVLKEKMFSWSGDSGEIYDAKTSVKYFRIKGKALNWKSKRVLYDIQDEPGRSKEGS